jgi:DNA-directed RNA polymerase subunit RPC12/RpoP
MISWSDNQTTGSQALNIFELFGEPFQGVTRFNQSGEPQLPVEGDTVYGPSYPSVARVHCDTTSRSLDHGFICKQCGKSYNWKQSLNNHVKMECGKEPQFSCPYCPHRAKHKWNLQKHVKMRHPEDIKWSS